ncbi:MAG: type II secretion system protein N [Pseudomonadota bacterium]
MGLLARYRVKADPLRTERRVEALAACLAALLVVQLLWTAVRLVTLSEPSPVEPAADALGVGEAAALAELEEAQREALRSRPLFWPSRRVAAVPQVANDEPKRQAGNTKGINLVGVFDAGDSAGIIVAIKGKQRRLRVGEQVDGWKLLSVDPTEVVLSSGKRRERLVLQRSTGQ